MPSIFTNGETISLYDPRVEIDRCLSCPYPVSMCNGENKCIYRLTGKPLGTQPECAAIHIGSKAQSIRECIRSGMNRLETAAAVGLTLQEVGRYIANDVKYGRLTREESNRSRVRPCYRGRS